MSADASLAEELDARFDRQLTNVATRIVLVQGSAGKDWRQTTDSILEIYIKESGIL